MNLLEIKSCDIRNCMRHNPLNPAQNIIYVYTLLQQKYILKHPYIFYNDKCIYRRDSRRAPYHLYYILYSGNLSLFKRSINHPDVVNDIYNHNIKLLKEAIKQNQIHIVHYFHKIGYDIKTIGQPVIHNIIDIRMIRYLQSFGIDVHTTTTGMTNLQRAMYDDNLRLLKFLVSQGVNINDSAVVSLYGHARINSDLETSYKYGYLRIIKYLMRHVNPDLIRPFLDTFIHDSCDHPENYHIIKILLKREDISTHSRENILNIACKYGHYKLVRLSLILNTDIPLEIPLKTAFRNGQLRIAKYLLKRGADASTCKNLLDTPQFQALYYLYTILHEKRNNVEFDWIKMSRFIEAFFT